MGLSAASQQLSDREQIQMVIEKYFDGTKNGEPHLVEMAFHKDLNLYRISEDGSLMVTTGTNYIKGIKPGSISHRIGKVMMIDIENNTAVAKATIEVPGWRVFTDYFLLVKPGTTWKILHKAYSFNHVDKGRE